MGEIVQINRYPVKSFAGESITSSKIEAYGIYGDRSHAFIDETKDGWDSYITARQIPDMLAYKAELVGDGTEDLFPSVRVTSADGRVLGWNAQLLSEIQAYSKQKISMIDYPAKTKELLAVDTGSILIITDESLRTLERIWGKKLEERRFRANLVVSLAHNGCKERDWLGKRLVIGDAEIKVDIECERCSMITIDPDTFERDASLLKKVNEAMSLHFGVYASVVKTGKINVGDRVFLAF
ncbi:MOSC domain-containing protein [Paenibacillus mesophilus]|nr:MOSC domain-containing protein [Paenibacillus mesophilus]